MITILYKWKPLNTNKGLNSLMNKKEPKINESIKQTFRIKSLKNINNSDTYTTILSS